MFFLLIMVLFFIRSGSTNTGININHVVIVQCYICQIISYNKDVC